MKIRRKPRPIHRKLMPHQVKGFRHCRKSRHPGLLMQMRLGKTLVAIRWVKYRDLPHVVVVAPITVLETWERELQMEGETFVRAYGVSKRTREAAINEVYHSPTRKWLLINYDSVRCMGARTVRLIKGKRRSYRAVPEFATRKWGACIVDESTKIRRNRSQTTQVFIKGWRNCRHRAILTGHITPESERDVFCQMLFLHGQFMGYTDWFKWLHGNFFKVQGSWYPKRGVLNAIKKEVHRLCFVKTRADAGMPDGMVYAVRYIPMTAKQKKLYTTAIKEFVAPLLSGEERETDSRLAVRSWLSKLAGGFDADNTLVSSQKADELIDLVTGELSGEKFVVWFRYRHELRYVQQRLEKCGITNVSVHGGVPAKERRRAIRRFREGSERALLATVHCAQFGMDASIADTEIYYSNDVGGEPRTQSQDRIVHPKKLRTLLCIDLITQGTHDEDTLTLVKKKDLNGKQFMTALEQKILLRYRKQFGGRSVRSRTR